MKKLIYVFALSLAAAPLHAAASTCETRVDKNLDKSTRQKVEFCLTEEPEEEPAPTEVIISDTYSVQYPKPKEPKAAPAQQVIEKYTPGPVSQEYLDRDDYPAFRNDSLPRLSDEEAHETALDALHQQATAAQSVKAQKPARKKASKPARKKAQPAPAPAPAEAEPEAALTQPQQLSQQQPQPVVPTQTPAAELEQAQALQNDPLYTNYTDNGATPQGFSDNGIYQDDFGYNDTDPALQP